MAKELIIRHLKRFNRFDEGHERKVALEDAKVWAKEGHCEIIKDFTPKSDPEPDPQEKKDENDKDTGPPGDPKQ